MESIDQYFSHQQRLVDYIVDNGSSNAYDGYNDYDNICDDD